MPNPSLKLVASIIGVGGVGTGAGIGVYSYLNKPVVSDNKTAREESQVVSKPIAEGLDDAVLLNADAREDEEQGKTNGGNFITDNNDKTNLDEGGNIQDGTNKKTQKQTVPTDFKTNCSNNSKVKIEKKEGDKYTKVKRYCTKAKPRQ